MIVAELLRVLHYINAFFGGLGGEEAAHTAVSLQDGALGPGRLLEQILADAGQVIATVMCGDGYFGAHEENPGSDLYRPQHLFIIATAGSAVGLQPALDRSTYAPRGQGPGQQGHHGRHPTGGPLRKALTYRVHGPRNTRAGTSPPARKAPGAYRNTPVKDVQQRGQPVGSVETQDQAVGGRRVPTVGVHLPPTAGPSPVRVHDVRDTRGGQRDPLRRRRSDAKRWLGSAAASIHEPAAWAVATGPQGGQRMGQALDSHGPADAMFAFINFYTS